MAVLLSTGTDHMLQGLNRAQGFCGARRIVGTEAARQRQLLRHRHVCQEGDHPGLCTWPGRKGRRETPPAWELQGEQRAGAPALLPPETLIHHKGSSVEFR